MDINLHRVSKITLSDIRESPTYSVRDIIITTDKGDVTITVFSEHGNEDNANADMLKVRA